MNEPIAADKQKYPAHAAFTVHGCLDFGFAISLDFGLVVRLFFALFNSTHTH